MNLNLRKLTWKSISLHNIPLATGTECAIHLEMLMNCICLRFSGAYLPTGAIALMYTYIGTADLSGDASASLMVLLPSALHPTVCILFRRHRHPGLPGC